MMRVLPSERSLLFIKENLYVRDNQYNVRYSPIQGLVDASQGRATMLCDKLHLLRNAEMEKVISQYQHLPRNAQIKKG